MNLIDGKIIAKSAGTLFKIDLCNNFEWVNNKVSVHHSLNINESEYDAFGAGHSSTSVSAALGFAHSRDIQKKNNEYHFT